MTHRTTDAPFSQSIYRLVRSVNRAYAFAVLWCYIAAFVVAFALMFVFPPGTLLLVFLGVFGLVAAVGGAQILGGIEHHLARRLIRHDRCPGCGLHRSLEPIARVRTRDARGPAEASDRLACSGCGAAFERWGGEIESVSSMALLIGGTLGGPGAELAGAPKGGTAGGSAGATGRSARHGRLGRGGSSVSGAPDPR